MPYRFYLMQLGVMPAICALLLWAIVDFNPEGIKYAFPLSCLLYYVFTAFVLMMKGIKEDAD